MEGGLNVGLGGWLNVACYGTISETPAFECGCERAGLLATLLFLVCFRFDFFVHTSLFETWEKMERETPAALE